MKSFEVIKYNNTKNIIIKIISNEGNTGFFTVPINYDKFNNHNSWGNVEWNFESNTGVLIFETTGILGEFNLSPWNRTDEKRIDPNSIKKIVFNSTIFSPIDSASLFSGLNNLESFEKLGNLNTSFTTNMRDMFAYNKVLTRLDLSTFDTSNVENFQGMFYLSPNIKYLDISNFSTKTVKHFPYMFDSLSNLEVIKLGENSIFKDQKIGIDINHEWINLDYPDSVIGTNETLLTNYDSKRSGTFIWKKHFSNYHTITFDSNGGSIKQNTIREKAGTSIDLRNIKATRDGYIFNGWYTESTSGTIVPDVVKISNSDITYYAKWKTNAKSFRDFFPDENLSKVIAQQFNKNSNDVTSKDELDTLKVLQVGKKSISSLEGIENLSNLEELVANYNSLETIPDSIGELQNLKVLYLNDNQLIQVPDTITNLSNLTILNVMTNQLTRLPENIGMLSELSMLYIGANKLTELPESITELSKLKGLFMSHNLIENLPNELGNLSKLNTISSKYNLINSIPDSIGNLTDLEFLYLSNNRINTELNSTFKNLTNLRELYLDNNQMFGSLPDWLLQLPNLDILNTANNNFSGGLPFTNN